METTSVVKRVTIRNLKHSQKPRMFDVLVMGREVYIDLKSDMLGKAGRTKRELIAINDVLDQVKDAVEQPP